MVPWGVASSPRVQNCFFRDVLCWYYDPSCPGTGATALWTTTVVVLTYTAYMCFQALCFHVRLHVIIPLEQVYISNIALTCLTCDCTSSVRVCVCTICISLHRFKFEPYFWYHPSWSNRKILVFNLKVTYKHLWKLTSWNVKYWLTIIFGGPFEKFALIIGKLYQATKDKRLHFSVYKYT